MKRENSCGDIVWQAIEEGRAALPTWKRISLTVSPRRSLAARHQIRGIPNFVVYSGGKPVMQQAGVVDSTQMIAWLAKEI